MLLTQVTPTSSQIYFRFVLHVSQFGTESRSSDYQQPLCVYEVTQNTGRWDTASISNVISGCAGGKEKS